MKLKDLKLNTLDWQQGKNGKFRLVEVRKGAVETWINRVLCFDWFYTFKYENNEKFEVHFDEKGNYVK